MKKVFTICLIMATTFTINAQSLSGTQALPGDRGGAMAYTVLNWKVNYSIYEKNGFYYILLNNPSVSVADNSLYGSYSKSDLGLSSWPDSDPKPYNFKLNLTIQYPGGSIAVPVGTRDYDEVMIGEPKNKYSKTYNLSISSFKVSSVESMSYNGGRDGVVDKLIEEKKN